MSDYDVDVRSIEPEYKHTIDNQAGRKVDDGREVHLATVTVMVKVSWTSGSDTYDITYRFDHEQGTATMASIGDSFTDVQSFDVATLSTAIEYAQRAMIAFLEDVGPDYYIRGFKEQIDSTAEFGDDVRVHTDLEVDA